ncbi:MAG TPA: MFS transporter [Ktedonobacteraceae bacterium]|jgi:EmrB/QacA subfamily drug resistance transporter|nr:MFS transporter [Ktedonobacteraceae bacterium]
MATKNISEAHSTQNAELSDFRRNLVLILCCISVFLAGLDTSILNIALPSIQHDFHASISEAQWTLDAYTLVIASILMLSSSTADRVGRRRIFQIGVSLFTLGSLLCSLAPDITWLIVFRMMQAVGGSMLNPVAMSIISNTFIEPSERARAIGAWGGVAGISLSLGPILGGFLVNSIGWRSIFWINVPIGIVVVLLTARFVPESKAPHPRRFDPIGQVLVIALLGLLIYGIIEVPSYGWTSFQILACLLGAAICLVGLIGYERVRQEPLIDIRFFRSAPFSGASVIALCAFMAQGGFMILNTLYLQDILHFSPLQAGITFLPMAVFLAISSPLSGRVVGRYGSRRSLLIGGVAIAIAGLLAAILYNSLPFIGLLVCYALVGAGIGWANASISNTALAGMPRAQAGAAAGIASTMRQLGAALGVAIIGSVIASRVTHLTASSGFADAYRISWSIIAACGFAVLFLGLITTGAWAKRTATQNAQRMQLEMEHM